MHVFIPSPYMHLSFYPSGRGSNLAREVEFVRDQELPALVDKALDVLQPPPPPALPAEQGSMPPPLEKRKDRERSKASSSSSSSTRAKGRKATAGLLLKDKGHDILALDGE